jgi:hypothetical protein
MCGTQSFREGDQQMPDDDNDDEETHLTSEQMPNPLQDGTCGWQA